MKKKEDFTTRCFCATMLLLPPAGIRSQEPNLSRQNFLDSPICTASVNHDDFYPAVEFSYLLEKAVKAEAYVVLLIQRRYNY